MGKANLRTVALPILPLQAAMDAASLQGAVRSSKTVVNAAAPQHKFNQLPDRKLDHGFQSLCLLFKTFIPL